MTDIGPNPNLNKWLCGFVGLFAVLPLYFGVDSLSFLAPDARGFSYACIGLGAAMLAWAAWLWRRPPINAARITFRPGGFQLEARQVLRGARVSDLSWSRIEDVSIHDGGAYGGRTFIIRTRDIGNVTFGAAWVSAPRETVMARLGESAEAAGYTLEKAPPTLASVVRTRWLVRPLDAESGLNN